MQDKVAGGNVSPVIMDRVPVVTPSSLLHSFPVGEKKELGRRVTLPGSWLRGKSLKGCSRVFYLTTVSALMLFREPSGNIKFGNYLVDRFKPTHQSEGQDKHS